MLSSAITFEPSMATVYVFTSWIRYASSTAFAMARFVEPALPPWKQPFGSPSVLKMTTLASFVDNAWRAIAQSSAPRMAGYAGVEPPGPTPSELSSRCSWTSVADAAVVSVPSATMGLAHGAAKQESEPQP